MRFLQLRIRVDIRLRFAPQKPKFVCPPNVSVTERPNFGSPLDWNNWQI